MNTKDFVFSASSFKDYLQCGLKFKYSRIDKRDRTDVSSHHRWFGTLVHSLIYSAIATPGNNGGKDLVLRDRVNKAYPMTILDTLWDEKPSKSNVVAHIRKSLDAKPVGKFMVGKVAALGNKNPDITQAELELGWKSEAKSMVKNGISIASSIPTIVELEKKINWTFLDRKFVGYLDILAKDDNGRYVFYDFKTSWSKPGKSLNNDFQFFYYAYALRQVYNLDYYPAGYFVHLRSGDALKFQATPEIRADMQEKAASAFRTLEADIFFDAYGSPLCSYCDFRHICYGEDDKVWRTDTNL